MWKAIEQAKNNKTNKTNEATHGMNMEGLMIQFQKHEEINPRCFLLSQLIQEEVTATRYSKGG